MLSALDCGVARFLLHCRFCHAVCSQGSPTCLCCLSVCRSVSTPSPWGPLYGTERLDPSRLWSTKVSVWLTALAPTALFTAPTVPCLHPSAAHLSACLPSHPCVSACRPLRWWRCLRSGRGRICLGSTWAMSWQQASRRCRQSRQRLLGRALRGPAKPLQRRPLLLQRHPQLQAPCRQAARCSRRQQQQQQQERLQRCQALAAVCWTR